MNVIFYLESIITKQYRKHGLSLSGEEKLLCLVPAIGAYTDYFLTFLLAGSSVEVLARETNQSLKPYIVSNFALFLLLVGSPLLIFAVFTGLVTLLKLTGSSQRGLQYAAVFTYLGYRVAGGLTWLS